MPDGLSAFEPVLHSLRTREVSASIEILEAWHTEYDRALALTNDPALAEQAADELGHIWLCDGCNREYKSDFEAGCHADDSGHWLWRFPDPYSMDDKADQEIHWSDYGGWYQSDAKIARAITVHQLFERRAKDYRR